MKNELVETPAAITQSAGLTLEQIQSSVRSGRNVFWSNPNYQVILTVLRNGSEQWLIKCLSNGSCIGLTWANGTTVNGKPEEFFIR